MCVHTKYQYLQERQKTLPTPQTKNYDLNPATGDREYSSIQFSHFLHLHVSPMY